MKIGRFAVLMLVLTLPAVFPAQAWPAEDGSPDTIMDAAAKAIDEGDLDSSIETLEGIRKEGLSDDTLSRLHFLLGKASYIKVSEDLRSCRSEGTQKKDELQKYQVQPLIDALDHMNKSYELSPDSDWAPQALYAAGLIQDYGCLQRFDSAAETYKILAEKYPDTTLGRAAAERFRMITSGFQGKGHGTPAKSHP